MQGLFFENLFSLNFKLQFLSSPPHLVFFLCSRAVHVISQLANHFSRTFIACFNRV